MRLRRQMMNSDDRQILCEIRDALVRMADTIEQLRFPMWKVGPMGEGPSPITPPHTSPDPNAPVITWQNTMPTVDPYTNPPPMPDPTAYGPYTPRDHLVGTPFGDQLTDHNCMDFKPGGPRQDERRGSRRRDQFRCPCGKRYHLGGSGPGQCWELEGGGE